MKLRPIKHDLKTVLWCGPAVLASLTGFPTSHVMSVLRHVTGRQVVQGVRRKELEAAASFLGIRLVPVPALRLNYGKTMAFWTRKNRDLLSKSPVVLLVTGHYVAVQGRTFIDNSTKAPVRLKSAPRRRCRVKWAWTVEAQPGPSLLPPVEPARPKVNPAKLAAYKLACSVPGLEIDREHRPGSDVEDVIWVFPPPALSAEENDRFAGEHSCYEWDEVLRRVVAYASDLKKLTAGASSATV